MRSRRAVPWSWAVLVTVLLSGCASAPVTSLRDFTQGSFKFTSYRELTWAEILQTRFGDKPKADIPAELLLPKHVAGPVPVMVIMHGSGGLRYEREYRYASELNKEGIAAALLDSFAPRGLMTTGAQQERLSTLTMVGDVYALLNLLTTHPRVDPARIGVMGFSKGGSVTVFALDEQVRSALAAGPARFAVGVAFYPGCVVQLRRPRPTTAPLFLLLGEQDSYTPAVQCERQAASLTAAGGAVTITKYPGAHHGWDSITAVRFTNFDYSYGRCRFEIDETGTTMDVNSGRPLLSVDDARVAIEACGSRGVSVGATEDVARRSLADLKAILRRAFARPE
jgi:dienelactone hydrolase